MLEHRVELALVGAGRRMLAVVLVVLLGAIVFALIGLAIGALSNDWRARGRHF